MLGPVLICESRICELLFRQIMNSKVPIREASSFSDGDAPQGPTTATGGPQVALNKIFHHIANNTVPESIRHALCSINYTILEKANGKFRPVGTDSIFNKVVNRALLEQQQPHIAHLLQASPELAVGVKDGISAAVGMAFGELQACESTPGWTMLSLDFKSAFNYTDRARLHEIVADKVPGLLRAFERHYARPTTHCIVDKFFKVIDIDVGQGIVQGNELSPFFFALYSCGVLGLRDATTDYRCKVIKYLDDIVLMGPAEDVAADVEIIKAPGEHSESEQDVLLSDPAPPIAANVLDAQRKVLLKTSGHRQLLACPFGLCKCKGPRLDRKAWVNHVLREHPYDEQATDLVKQVMEAKLVAQCNKCHLFFEAAGISQHRSRCGANLKRATEALFHAAGHDLLEIMRGAWPQQCVGSRISVCELLKLARHPLMQRSRYPSNATETKLMAATLSQLY
ncbi:uncharacterized protein MONBRDRAFT_13165, partial [Monosiga brevicollis MX1]